MNVLPKNQRKKKKSLVSLSGLTQNLMEKQNFMMYWELLKTDIVSSGPFEAEISI